MLSHFGVGAARSFFTGRGVFRSGMDMFLVGLGVAGFGYLLGRLDRQAAVSARIDSACRNTFRGSHRALIRCRRG